MSLKSELLENIDAKWGLEISSKTDEERKKRKIKTFAPPQNLDGSQLVSGSDLFTSFISLDAPRPEEENQLIDSYRDMSLSSEVDPVIDSIVDDIIVIEDDKDPIELNLDDVDLSVGIKNKILENWDYILWLYGIRKYGHEMVRNFYIDGRQFYHLMLDVEKKHDGILEVRYVDSKQIKKRKQLKNGMGASSLVAFQDIEQSEYEDFYEYFPLSVDGSIQQVNGFKIASDSVAYAHSGIFDSKTKVVLSYLHKAIKPHNVLRMLEDATVIYRIARAPERRVFNIDCGGMQPSAMEKYMEKTAQNFKNKLSYDTLTGEVMNERRLMTMLQDFFIPRRDGGKGTTIETLPGGEHLGKIEDVEYFRSKMYRALGIPLSRLSEGGGTFNFGRQSEINRDEMQFAKFIKRIRNSYIQMFEHTLKVQLILKNIIEVDEWPEISKNIKYQWASDNLISEMKEMDVWSERIAQLKEAEPYIGPGGYFSKQWARKNILRQTDEDIEQIDKELDEEEESEFMSPEGLNGPGDEEQNGIPKDNKKPDINTNDSKNALQKKNRK